MQSYTDAEQHLTKLAVEAAREHIETDLRDEIRALKAMLLISATVPSHALKPPSPNFINKGNP